jgi:hypothetical protein
MSEYQHHFDEPSSNGTRELTSKEIHLVSGGVRDPSPTTTRGPGIWGDPDYVYGGRFNPIKSPAQVAAEQAVLHHFGQAAVGAAAGASRGGGLWGAAVWGAAGFVSSFL